MTAKALACGHEPKPTSVSPGYGEDPTTGERYCFDCCTKRDKEDLKTAQVISGYFSRNHEVEDQAWDSFSITNWPGGKLMRITSRTKRQVGFGGERWYLRATDVHGAKWHGTSPGPGMYATMRRSKS